VGSIMNVLKSKQVHLCGSLFEKNREFLFLKSAAFLRSILRLLGLLSSELSDLLVVDFLTTLCRQVRNDAGEQA